jgi:ArsR family transcriptional regulator
LTSFYLSSILVAMSAKPRPIACCVAPVAPLELPEREQLVYAFKALADPTRLDVFRLIAAQEAPLCACDVVDRFDVSQPTISHHLKVLREAGLITVSRRGIWAYYAADHRGLARLRELVDAVAPERPGSLLPLAVAG